MSKAFRFFLKAKIGQGSYASVWKIEFLIPYGTQLGQIDERGFPEVSAEDGRVKLHCPCELCDEERRQQDRMMGEKGMAGATDANLSTHRDPGGLGGARGGVGGPREETSAGADVERSSPQRGAQCWIRNPAGLIGTGLEYALKIVESKMKTSSGCPVEQAKREEATASLENEKRFLEKLQGSGAVVELFLFEAKESALFFVLELARSDFSAWMKEKIQRVPKARERPCLRAKTERELAASASSTERPLVPMGASDPSPRAFRSPPPLPRAPTSQRLEKGRQNERERSRLLSVDELLHIWNQLVEHVNTIHTRGIVHFDLKPGNILVVNRKLPAAFAKLTPTSSSDKRARGADDFPVLTLSDFGLAEQIRASETHLSMSRGCRGTVRYMAPEILHQPSPTFKFSSKVDVWSLGMLLHELMNHGIGPFDYLLQGYEGRRAEGREFRLLLAIGDERALRGGMRAGEGVDWKGDHMLRQFFAETVASCLTFDPDARVSAESLRSQLVELRETVSSGSPRQVNKREDSRAEGEGVGLFPTSKCNTKDRRMLRIFFGVLSVVVVLAAAIGVGRSLAGKSVSTATTARVGTEDVKLESDPEHHAHTRRPTTTITTTETMTTSASSTMSFHLPPVSSTREKFPGHSNGSPAIPTAPCFWW